MIVYLCRICTTSSELLTFMCVFVTYNVKTDQKMVIIPQKTQLFHDNLISKMFLTQFKLFL
jgi:hypothetical protein